MTDAVGTPLRYEYNRFGLEVRVVDVLSGATLSEKTYDKLLRLATEKGPGNSAVISYTYDAMNRPLTKSTGSLYSEVYAYSIGQGKLRAVKTIQGGTESNNLVSVTYTNYLGQSVAEGKSNGTSETLTVYTYDYLGRKTTAKNALENTTKSVYNYLGPVISETNTDDKTVYFGYAD